VTVVVAAGVPLSSPVAATMLPPATPPSTAVMAKTAMRGDDHRRPRCGGS